ncbi:hypothetical protein FCL47_10015 [Desulfopila sp. IMCC35006]|uniref:hypothetical protein n=1 Tax=Desulfopila sp. IMCC35006 TaxID=2569542 RepID=UPI0010AC0E24|nr:hypothetical protein [Desulfopila sp. IMCC35006]TKB26076.1 hypothetical protein FCL47_10015 [Desulfopila sp. IMCC35006]
MKHVQRKEIDGLFQYHGVVTKNGERISSTVFSDWFVSDSEAEKGFAEIMSEQGYRVVSVKIGEITEVEIA